MKKLLNISDLKQNDFEDIISFADELNDSNENILTN